MDSKLNEVMTLVLKLEQNAAYAILTSDFLQITLQEVPTKTSLCGGQ